jgi:glycosyltransferase involved in cell wall biosynthesis
VSPQARRVLLLTYYWPPAPGSGAFRWAALVKYLRAAGHDVTVMTTSAFGAASAEEGTVRVGDLASSSLLRRLLRRPPVGQGDPAASAAPPARHLSRILVPDPAVVGWAPFAARAARRFLRENPVDCVITSSPPESVHLAGLALGRRRPAWIADLRDGWTFEPMRPEFPTSAQRRLDQRLEGRVMRTADAVVAATEPIALDLTRRYGIPSTTIRNAWDPELEAEVSSARPPELEPNRFNLVYTGSLGGLRGHDERALLEAVRQIVREDDDQAGRLRLVIAGSLTDAERRELSGPELSPVVRLLGPLPRPEALALQRRADALLLITSHHSSIATAKLYEYLAADRPILALAGRNEAARIVEETATGVVVPPDDVAAIRRALASAAAGELGGSFRPRRLDRYRFPATATALEEAIEAAISAANLAR